MHFLGYAAVRLGWLVAVLLGVMTLTFVVTNLVPADPARLAVGLRAPRSEVETMRHLMGLDQPLPVQYVTYIRRVLHADFGVDAQSQRPVAEEVAQYFPATLELVITTLMLYVVLGVGGGIVAAVLSGSWTDRAVQLFSLAGLAIPGFWLAIVLQVVFFARLHWLPVTGRLSTGLEPPPHVTGLYLIDSAVAGKWGTWRDAAAHLVLPSVTLLVGTAANVIRITRRAMLRAFSEPFIVTANAKGLAKRTVIWRHVFRNAAMPILTWVGLETGYLFSGAIIVETVFAWPGLGKYAVDSITDLDFPPIMAVTLIIAIVFVLVNLVVDLLYPLFDPRITY